MDSSKKNDLIGKLIVITLIAIFVIVGIVSMTGKSKNPAGIPGGMPPGMRGPSEATQNKVNTVTVSVKAMVPETIQRTVLLNGNVSSKIETNIYPDTSGKVTNILKNVGDSVSKGEIIAYVDPSKPGSAYAASPVKATVTGTIIQLPYNIGDTVSSNNALAVIGSLKDLEVTVNVSEKYSSYLKNGLPAYLSLISAPEEIFTAKISSISPVVNKDSRSQQVKLTLDQKDERIKPGMFAQVRLVIQEEKDTFAIPQKAIKTFNDEFTVFVVDDQNKAQRKVVTIGISNDSETQITSGLEEGDLVITAGSVTQDSLVKIAGTSNLKAN